MKTINKSNFGTMVNNSMVNNSMPNNSIPKIKPKLVEQSGVMFLDGIRIYSLALDDQMQKSNQSIQSNQYIQSDNDFSWSSFFEIQFENIHMFFSNTYESIYLKLFGNYQVLSSDDIDESDEFEI